MPAGIITRRRTVLAPAAVAAGPNPSTFSYTGAAQTFTVPAGVTVLHCDVQGAEGGLGSAGPVPGKGGRIVCDLTVTPGQVLQINVGQAGALNSGVRFGGGGSSNASGGFGGSGGGGSDIRSGAYALADRVVAVGGGGGAGGNGGGNGGSGGGDNPLANGVTGVAAGASAGGVGGSSTTGGGGGNGSGGNGGAGVLGVGGNADNGNIRQGGGGGGGWYGGGAGGNGTTGQSGGGGGGGSSFGTGVNQSGARDYRSGNGQVIVSW